MNGNENARRKIKFVYIKTLHMKIILSLLLAIGSFQLLNAQTIFLVRHGEKANYEGVDLKNPPLSEKGLKRAHDLKETLAPEKIDVVYVTNTIRSYQTAEQVYTSRNLQPVEYDPMPSVEWVKSIIDAKKNVLIVAHSNTIAHIYNTIEEAVGREKTAIEHSEDVYNLLYTFYLKNLKKVRITVVNYGSAE